MDLACDLVLETYFHTELSETHSAHLQSVKFSLNLHFTEAILHIYHFPYIKDCLQTSLFCPRDTSCFLVKLVLGLNVSFSEKL